MLGIPNMEVIKYIFKNPFLLKKKDEIQLGVSLPIIQDQVAFKDGT